MIRSILTALLLTAGTPALATPGGVWFKDMYYAVDELPQFCVDVATEVQEAEDEGIFTPGYAQEVYIRCLEWSFAQV